MFYKTIVEKYFPEATCASLASRILVFVTHGVPAHNPFLHMFEPEKDCVYLDYGAVTIVEKIGRSNASSSGAPSSTTASTNTAVQEVKPQRGEKEIDYLT